ncbi:Uma2 family endonuclease [Actinophytocola gossypii]|nr:Uma2 family endonuclease [Actinophytocola gossypii]
MPRPAPEPAHSLHPLTIAEYAELGETEHGYTELVEGRLLMSPSPTFHHNRALGRLHVQLSQQLPADLEAIPELDVDLELTAPDEPGHSRRPDIMVVKEEAGKRIADEGGLVRASEVILVVEIVSPGSRRTDHVDKRREYADAGIPHYWMLDIDYPPAITACHWTEEFGYQDDQVTTGIFRTRSPFSFEVDLGRLR